MTKKKMKKWKDHAGAELGQAQIKLELGFTSTNLHWKVKTTSLIVLVEYTNFPFYNILNQLEIVAELAIASYSSW